MGAPQRYHTRESATLIATNPLKIDVEDLPGSGGAVDADPVRGGRYDGELPWLERPDDTGPCGGAERPAVAEVDDGGSCGGV